ncbi:MAG: ABC transporter ATP-binding protein, partial [Polyangiales bacterium]
AKTPESSRSFHETEGMLTEIVRKWGGPMRESRRTWTGLQLQRSIASGTWVAQRAYMIEVQALTRRYGSRLAVNEVSFRVERGEIVGFLGPNGAGKTTTLRMLTGYLAPTSGEVHIDGIDAVRNSIEARARLGYMPEGVPLYREMRVYEYLRHRAALKGVDRVADAVDRSLESAGVTDARRRIIGQLSKGYRQRVGLAESLLADPPILILDEPTSGLDPNQVRQFRELVRGFAGDKTVLLSTHILSEVEAVCDRVIIIREGEKVADLAPEESKTSLEDIFAELTASQSTGDAS